MLVLFKGSMCPLTDPLVICRWTIMNQWTIEPVRRTKQNWIWNWNQTNRKATTVEKWKRKMYYKKKTKRSCFILCVCSECTTCCPPSRPSSSSIGLADLIGSQLFSLCSAQLCSVCLWNWSVSETLTVRKPIRNASKPKEHTGLYENQAHLILYYIYLLYIYFIYIHTIIINYNYNYEYLILQLDLSYSVPLRIFFVWF